LAIRKHNNIVVVVVAAAAAAADDDDNDPFHPSIHQSVFTHRTLFAMKHGS